MSKGPPHRSIAESRQKRTGYRRSTEDIIGLSWKEERDLSKAMYDSLRRTRHLESKPIRRSRVSNKHNLNQRQLRSSSGSIDTKEKVKQNRKPVMKTTTTTQPNKIPIKNRTPKFTVDESSKKILSTVRLRPARPYAGSFTYKNLLSASIRTLNATSNPKRFRGITKNYKKILNYAPNLSTRRPRSPIKRYLGVHVPNQSKSVTNSPEKHPNQNIHDQFGETLEILIEGEDGEFTPQFCKNTRSRSWKKQICPKLNASKMPIQPAINFKFQKCISSTHLNGVSNSRIKPNTTQQTFRIPVKSCQLGTEISTGTRIRQHISISSTRDTVQPYLWHDAVGNPVNTHDFVDFLCYYGTPCLSKKLSWFILPPKLRKLSKSFPVVYPKTLIKTPPTLNTTSKQIFAAPTAVDNCHLPNNKPNLTLVDNIKHRPTSVVVARKTASLKSSAVENNDPPLTTISVKNDCTKIKSRGSVKFIKKISKNKIDKYLLVKNKRRSQTPPVCIDLTTKGQKRPSKSIDKKLPKATSKACSVLSTHRVIRRSQPTNVKETIRKLHTGPKTRSSPQAF